MTWRWRWERQQRLHRTLCCTDAEGGRSNDRVVYGLASRKLLADSRQVVPVVDVLFFLVVSRCGDGWQKPNQPRCPPELRTLLSLFPGLNFGWVWFPEVHSLTDISNQSSSVRQNNVLCLAVINCRHTIRVVVVGIEGMCVVCHVYSLYTADNGAYVQCFHIISKVEHNQIIQSSFCKLTQIHPPVSPTTMTQDNKKLQWTVEA